MSTIRQEQIQNALVEEISIMLQRELKDPRLGFITVTGAEVTRDLRYAKVFVTVLGDEKEKKDSMLALKSASRFIRGEFTRRLRLRVAPELEFFTDSGIDRGNRIFELLHQVQAELKPDDKPVESGRSGDTPGA